MVEETEPEVISEKTKVVASITTIYDNYLSAEALAEAGQLSPELKTDWGFSCLVEINGEKILFDTGANGEVLLSNTEKLKIDPQVIDSVVISHDHYDHYGGLADFLAQNNQVKVYILSDLHQTRNIAKDSGAEVIEVDSSSKISEYIYTTGRLGGSIKEHSLIVKTEEGLVIITGCSHPGIVNIVRKVKELFPKEEIYLVLGGFHLTGASDSELKSIISDFRKLEVEKVAPCHCSGDRCRELFEQEYQNDFIANGVGKIIEIK